MFISLSSTVGFSWQISEMSIETRRLSLFPFLSNKIVWLMQTKEESVYFHSQFHITVHHSGKVAVVGGWGGWWHHIRNRKRWMCTCWFSTRASTYTALIWSRNKIGLPVSTKEIKTVSHKHFQRILCHVTPESVSFTMLTITVKV